jgi:ribosomal protein L19E
MSGAVISEVQLCAGHDGAAELVLTLRFDGGGETRVALGEDAADHLMTACDADDADALVGQGWERVRDALETSSNRFAGTETHD